GLLGGGTSGAVTLGIAPGGVTSTELASNAVTSSKIAANAVTAGAIAPGQGVKNINGVTHSASIVRSGPVTGDNPRSTITVGGGGAPSGTFVLGAPGDTTLIGAGYTEIVPRQSDYWTPTSTAGAAPSPRELHTAVWTGTRMVIWGGYQSTWLGDGGRYDPVSDSWTSVSTSSAPSVRAAHTAVWTGTEIVIWGGYGPGFTNPITAGRYNPGS